MDNLSLRLHLIPILSMSLIITYCNIEFLRVSKRKRLLILELILKIVKILILEEYLNFKNRIISEICIKIVFFNRDLKKFTIKKNI